MELRESIRQNPNNSPAHNHLGLALSMQGKLEEATAAYREAVRLDPDNTDPHVNLGNVLRAQGKLDEAIAEYREGLRLNPRANLVHTNVGHVLRDQGKLDEAVVAYRAALVFNQDDAKARANLGITLAMQGKTDEAVAELRRSLDSARADPETVHAIEREIVKVEFQSRVTARLPAYLAGTLKPGDTDESLGLARLFHRRQLYGASARFWAETFKIQPALAEDMQAANRHYAACAAAMAGAGQGKDDPPLDDKAKACWRKQAPDWLKADLLAWSKILEGGSPQASKDIVETILHWNINPDLAGLREPSALAKLPEDEQRACRALWTEVAALLSKCQNIGPKPGN
jgi:tetratricopeptide (TPR) repeat protein